MFLQKIGICSLFIINYVKLVLKLTWSTLSVSSEELFYSLDLKVPGRCVRAIVTGEDRLFSRRPPREAFTESLRLKCACARQNNGSPKDVHFLIPEV